MIAFEFDRPRMRRKLALYASITYGGMTTVLFAFLCAVSYTAHSHWVMFIIWPTLFVALIYVSGYAPMVLILRCSLKQRSSALVINNLGFVDNASLYALGQFGWAEIEKIYPQTWTHRLFWSRWQKMPVVSRQRGIVVILKDDIDIQSRLRNKPRAIRYAGKEQFKTGRKVWLFIPEMLLDTPADEVMRRLNEFYVAQVRAK